MQDALTIIAPVDPARAASLHALMRDLQRDPAHNEVLPFGKLPGCHFGRVLALDESTDLEGKTIGPQLVLLSDCDGHAEQHLEALVDVAGEGIDRLFGHCAGYPRDHGGNGRARTHRLAFLRDKRVRTKANYVHRPGRTVQQIKREAELRTALEGFVGKHGLANIPALEARKQIRTFVESSPEWSWALSAPEDVGVRYRIENALHAASLPLGLIAFGPVVIPATLALLALVRLQEERDEAKHIRPTREHTERLFALEDFFAHSGFTAGGYVKRGWVRQTVLRGVLPLIGWGTRHLFTNDSLAGVKTIHFARWIPMDDGRRVVFASNYDGSLESYNNDFIDLVGWGLNLVFSNGDGYPSTRWLVLGGASREQEFKDFLRRKQIPTPVWFSAYSQLTARNVARNSKLRAGLRGRMNEREAQQWLRLF